MLLILHGYIHAVQDWHSLTVSILRLSVSLHLLWGRFKVLFDLLLHFFFFLSSPFPVVFSDWPFCFVNVSCTYRPCRPEFKLKCGSEANPGLCCSNEPVEVELKMSVSLSGEHAVSFPMGCDSGLLVISPLRNEKTYILSSCPPPYLYLITSLNLL